MSAINVVARPYRKPCSFAAWATNCSKPTLMDLFLRIVGAGGHGFQTTLRTICYSGSPQVFNIVPYLGAMAGGIYALVLMILGLPKAHDTSVGRVVVGVLVLPIVFIFGFVAVAGIVAAIVIPMFLH
jgi:hypothetical protein